MAGIHNVLNIGAPHGDFINFIFREDFTNNFQHTSNLSNCTQFFDPFAIDASLIIADIYKNLLPKLSRADTSLPSFKSEPFYGELNTSLAPIGSHKRKPKSPSNESSQCVNIPFEKGFEPLPLIIIDAPVKLKPLSEVAGKTAFKDIIWRNMVYEKLPRSKSEASLEVLPCSNTSLENLIEELDALDFLVDDNESEEFYLEVMFKEQEDTSDKAEGAK